MSEEAELLKAEVKELSKQVAELDTANVYLGSQWVKLKVQVNAWRSAPCRCEGRHVCSDCRRILKELREPDPEA